MDWRGAVAVGGLLGAASVTALLIHGYKALNGFSEVKAGVLYRSGHLSPRVMSQVLERYKIRTVVALREDVAFAREGQSEAEWVRRQGGRYVFLPCTAELRVPDVLRFLLLIAQPENRPVLVHCHQGRGRTGVMVAAFRICFEGWTAESAIREMWELGCPRDICERNRFLLKMLETSDWRKMCADQEIADRRKTRLGD